MPRQERVEDPNAWKPKHATKSKDKDKDKDKDNKEEAEKEVWMHPIHEFSRKRY